jgi:insulysin
VCCYQIHAAGYNHKLPVLLDLLLDRLASFDVLPERFSVVAEALVKEYANVKYQQPYQWALYRSEVRDTGNCTAVR